MISTIWNYAGHFLNVLFTLPARMTMLHWSIAAIILLVAGVFCMRGLGSRDKY